MRTLGLGLSRLICRNDKTEFVTELDIFSRCSGESRVAKTPNSMW